MNNELKKLIFQYNVISFDIYDTLLVRLFAKPTDLFKFIEINEKCVGFYDARIKAEKKARKSIKDIKEDVTLDEIYNYIDKDFQSFKNIELEYEKNYTIKHPQNYKIYQEAIKQNKTIILISDIYLPQSFIEKLLKENKYEKYQYLFLSGEVGQTKLKGSLYDYILKKLSLNPKEILHIGDDWNNDVKQAKQRGISGYHITPYLKKFLSKQENYKFKKYYENTKENIYAGILISQFALFDFENNQIENFNQKLGYYVAGISAYAYTNYIISISKNFDLLLFIARDGYLLEKVYKKICNFNKINPIDTQYVYAQRILKISSSLKKDNLYQLLKLYFQINKIKFNKWNLYFNVNKFYQQHKKELESWVNTNQKEYRNYYNNLGLSANKILTIDMMTNNFTSKNFISNIFKDKSVYGCFFSSPKKTYDSTNKIFIDGKFLFKNEYLYYLIEPLFSSPEKPLLTIRNNKPVYREENISTYDEYFIKKVKDTEIGMFYFIDNMLKYFKNITIPPNIINEYFYSYVKYSNKEDILEYKKIPLSDGNILNSVSTNLYSKLKRCIRNNFFCY